MLSEHGNVQQTWGMSKQRKKHTVLVVRQSVLLYSMSFPDLCATYAMHTQTFT